LTQQHKNKGKDLLTTAYNVRFCAMAGVARPKKMFNFAAQVARPKQSLARHCRQAAVTLYVMRGRQCG